MMPFLASERLRAIGGSMTDMDGGLAVPALCDHPEHGMGHMPRVHALAHLRLRMVYAVRETRSLSNLKTIESDSA